MTMPKRQRRFFYLGLGQYKQDIGLQNCLHQNAFEKLAHVFILLLAGVLTYHVLPHPWAMLSLLLIGLMILAVVFGNYFKNIPESHGPLAILSAIGLSIFYYVLSNPA